MPSMCLSCFHFNFFLNRDKLEHQFFLNRDKLKKNMIDVNLYLCVFVCIYMTLSNAIKTRVIPVLPQSKCIRFISRICFTNTTNVFSACRFHSILKNGVLFIIFLSLLVCLSVPGVNHHSIKVAIAHVLKSALVMWWYYNNWRLGFNFIVIF